MKKKRPRHENPLYERAYKLGLWGLVANWNDWGAETWVYGFIEAEEKERLRRGLERRRHMARIGKFKPIADFDWEWPKDIDRALIEDFFTLDFIEDNGNVIIVGPNGVGKTMIAKNLVSEAVQQGHSGLFVTASDMLNDLVAQDGPLARRRCLRKYCRPKLLAIDELGYLSYDNRHADLLFEVVTRRKGESSTLVTTNKPFSEWNEVFPNASCVVTLIDRLVHKAEVTAIKGDSYRFKEAKERSAKRAQTRTERNKHCHSTSGRKVKSK